MAKLYDISGIGNGCVFGHLPVPVLGGIAFIGYAIWLLKSPPFRLFPSQHCGNTMRISSKSFIGQFGIKFIWSKGSPLSNQVADDFEGNLKAHYQQ